MFEFYYQTGEFIAASDGFWDSFLGFLKDVSVQVIGTIFGGIIALSLYLQETEDQSVKEERSRLQKDVDNLRYFHFLIFDSIGAIESFSEALYKIADGLKGQFSKVPDLNFSKPIQSISRISVVMNQQEVFHSYQQLISYFHFSADRNEVSDIFKIIDVVNFNLPEFQKHYSEFSSLLVSSYNKLIELVGEQNSLIAYLKINGYDPLISEPLNLIKYEYVSAALARPDEWYVQNREKQIKIWNFLSQIDFGRHEIRLKPINDLNTNISQLLINIEGYAKSFHNWADCNAPDMYRYSRMLRSKSKSLDLFLKTSYEDSLTRNTVPKSFISRTLRMLASLIRKS